MRDGSDGFFSVWFHSLAHGCVSAKYAQAGRLGVSYRVLWLMVESMCESRVSSELGWLGFCVGC